MVSFSAIETEVPVPELARRDRPRNPVAKALAELKPGQSRVFTLGRDLDMAGLSKLAYRTLGKGGYRTAPAEQENQVRVWRMGDGLVKIRPVGPNGETLP